MAAADYLADLVSIRDSLAAELKAEMTRRATLVAAGHPPPTNYSMGGKSIQWDGYLSNMLKLISEANEAVIKAGAEGIPEAWLVSY